MTPQAVDAHTPLISETPVRVRPYRAPDEVQPSEGTSGSHAVIHKVAVVIPCCNRAHDAELLLTDLARLVLSDKDRRRRVQLHIVLVDNCSQTPLSGIRVPPGLDVEHLRLPTNTGGSGGYNAGVRHALGVDEAMQPVDRSAWGAWDADFVWMVDSDARVRPDTLGALLDAMQSDSTIVAAGAAVHDPNTGRCFEIAGRINRTNGIYEPAVAGGVGVRSVVDGDYVAAACALIRADVVRRVGVMPDRFLNGDDVEWFIRMRQVSGGRIVGVPGAVCWHPRFDRFPTWQRYYGTRNALPPLRALGVRRRVRFLRAMRDVCRATQQEMMQRPDLAKLHLAGLRDGASPDPSGTAPAGTIAVEPSRPLSELGSAIQEAVTRDGARSATVLDGPWMPREHRVALEQSLQDAGCRVVPSDSSNDGGVRAIIGLLSRLLRGSRADIAVVPARGRPSTWGHGRWVAQVGGGSFVLRRARPVWSFVNAIRTFARGTVLAWRAAGIREPGPSRLDPSLAGSLSHSEKRPALSLEAIVLSHNRWEALERTLARLTNDPEFAPVGRAAGSKHSITVVDNGSTDGTPERVRERFPAVRMMALSANVGVDAFNRAVSESTADVLLILDDDAAPEEYALTIALNRLARDPKLGAVALLPRHPSTGASEWPVAERFVGTSTDLWPFMGCANVVRREAWLAAGGYESVFFLYRNDTDLALKLLASGWGVHFDPGLVGAHDTPAGAGGAKSLRWHQLATRNWVWMARRHGRGPVGLAGAALGWLWAHKLAGLRLRAHAATLRGAAIGVVRTPPPWNPSHPHAPATGRAWASVVRLRLFGRV